jgi:uncharacterized sporulation protein YeaH/YhbH (DUF444 family)
MKIGRDHARFRKIVRGKIRRNLKKYITSGSLQGRKGKKRISIPVPHINIPRFRFDEQQKGGVGQGDGEVGDQVGPGQKRPGKGEAGEGEGDHTMEVDVSIEELAEILGEELELPEIKPKGDKNISEERHQYTGIQRSGPEGLKHFKRTYKEALKREMTTGVYDPDNPTFMPQQSDKRFRSRKTIIDPMANAVIIYMMDVSGSMGEEQKEIVRTESFWIDAWLTKQYKGLETRFIIHDSVAKEVNRETFFSTTESGGTMISSAFKLCKSIIENDYSPEDWNIYPFYFSDGDNWSADDNNSCIELLRNYLLPWSNMIAYGQVTSEYGSGQFFEELNGAFGDEPRVVLSKIDSRDDIIGSIKEFLGKGH